MIVEQVVSDCHFMKFKPYEISLLHWLKQIGITSFWEQFVCLGFSAFLMLQSDDSAFNMIDSILILSYLLGPSPGAHSKTMAFHNFFLTLIKWADSTVTLGKTKRRAKCQIRV